MNQWVLGVLARSRRPFSSCQFLCSDPYEFPQVFAVLKTAHDIPKEIEIVTRANKHNTINQSERDEKKKIIA